MKKLTILVAFVVCSIYANSAVGQQKNKTIDKQVIAGDIWVNLASWNGFVGSDTGQGLSCFLFRYKYVNFGIVSTLAPSHLPLFHKDNLYFFLPVGLHLPLRTWFTDEDNEIGFHLGLNSNLYWLRYKPRTQRDSTSIFNHTGIAREFPRMAEVELRLDGPMFSISGGYRFQFGAWEKRRFYYDNRISSVSPYLTEVEEIGKLRGAFLQISVGVMVASAERITKARIVKLPNPSLDLLINLRRYEGALMAGEQIELDVNIQNRGEGWAENLRLALSTDQPANSVMRFSPYQDIGNLAPYSSKTLPYP
jgi:hypothetical protein